MMTNRVLELLAFIAISMGIGAELGFLAAWFLIR